MAQPNPRYPTGERNLVMVRLMLNTGLRLSEATSLRWRDIDLMTGKLMVRQGKGAKDRALWIGEGDVESLQHWRERQIEVSEQACEYVFSTLKGKPLQNRYVQAMVSRYVDRAGIRKSVSPHTLRHTFATDLYRETGKIRLVQKVLGHADLSTTMIYTHVYDEEVKLAMRGFRDSEASRRTPPV